MYSFLPMLCYFTGDGRVPRKQAALRIAALVHALFIPMSQRNVARRTLASSSISISPTHLYRHIVVYCSSMQRHKYRLGQCMLWQMWLQLVQHCVFRGERIEKHSQSRHTHIKA